MLLHSAQAGARHAAPASSCNARHEADRVCCQAHQLTLCSCYQCRPLLCNTCDCSDSFAMLLLIISMSCMQAAALGQPAAAQPFVRHAPFVKVLFSQPQELHSILLRLPPSQADSAVLPGWCAMLLCYQRVALCCTAASFGLAARLHSSASVTAHILWKQRLS